MMMMNFSRNFNWAVDGDWSILLGNDFGARKFEIKFIKLKFMNILSGWYSWDFQVPLHCITSLFKWHRIILDHVLRSSRKVRKLTEILSRLIFVSRMHMRKCIVLDNPLEVQVLCFQFTLSAFSSLLSGKLFALMNEIVDLRSQIPHDWHDHIQLRIIFLSRDSMCEKIFTIKILMVPEYEIEKSAKNLNFPSSQRNFLSWTAAIEW